MWTKTFIGLGSNLNQPIQQIISALNALRLLPNSQFINHSSLYRTPPLGPPNQPAYINAVAVLATQLTPIELLTQLHIIENIHGRIRSDIRWEARSLDLDILLYGQLIVKQPQLIIPHPRLHQRAFVLIPLMEIASGELWIPNVGRLHELLKLCDYTGIECLTEVVDY